MYINENIESLNRAKCDVKRGEYIRLDMNENPVGLPEEFVRRVLDKITPELISMYPETAELAELVAEHLGVESNMLVFANGSDMILKTIFEVFGQPGAEMLSVTPTFAMYSIYAKMVGMSVVTVKYDDNFNISVDEIIKKINRNTGIISLVNPNNPMGNVYSEEDIIRIVQSAKENDAIVIIDEAYHYFYNKTAIGLLKQFDNIIITRTFSKLCSIAGLRIGYSVSSERFAKLISDALPTYTVDAVAIEFAKEIMKDKSIILSLIEKQRQGKEYIRNCLTESGYLYSLSYGNFIFIKTNKGEEYVSQKLKECGILIKTYSLDNLHGYIRVSVGDADVMRKFWNEFKRIDMQ